LVLAANGFVPCAKGRDCRNRNAAHTCCGPAVSMQADCCDLMHDASAIAPASNADFDAARGIMVRAEIAPRLVCGTCAQMSAESRPPGLLGPPIVLRT